MRQNPGVLSNTVGRMEETDKNLYFENMAGMLNKNLQKHSPIGVHQNSCSTNMQQIYRKTPMWKCDFNKVAMKTCLQNTFFEKYLWQTAMMLSNVCLSKLPPPS